MGPNWRDALATASSSSLFSLLFASKSKDKLSRLHPCEKFSSFESNSELAPRRTTVFPLRSAVTRDGGFKISQNILKGEGCGMVGAEQNTMYFQWFATPFNMHLGGWYNPCMIYPTWSRSLIHPAGLWRSPFPDNMAITRISRIG